MKPLMPFAIRSSRALFTRTTQCKSPSRPQSCLAGLLAQPRVAAAVHLAIHLESMAEAMEFQRGKR